MGMQLANRRVSFSLARLSEGTLERVGELIEKLGNRDLSTDNLRDQLTGAALQTFDVFESSLYVLRSAGELPLIRRRVQVADFGSPIRAGTVLEEPLPSGSSVTTFQPAKVGDTAKKLRCTGIVTHPLNDEIKLTVNKGTNDPVVAGTYEGEVEVGGNVVAKLEVEVV